MNPRSTEKVMSDIQAVQAALAKLQAEYAAAQATEELQRKRAADARAVLEGIYPMGHDLFQWIVQNEDSFIETVNLSGIDDREVLRRLLVAMYGMEGHPKLDALARIVWVYGHASGFVNMLSVAEDFIDLVDR